MLLTKFLVGPYIVEELEDLSKEPVDLITGAAENAEDIDEGGLL